MKAKLFSMFLLVLVSGSLFASPVDTTIAKIVAKNFFATKVNQSSQAKIKKIASTPIELKLTHQELDVVTDQNHLEPIYYVFNVTGNNGFVIISADDEVTPVLGYSYEGEFKSENLSPALIEWLDNYKRQIKYVKTNKSGSPSKAKTEWVQNKVVGISETETASTEVSPLLGSIAWSQGKYYNQLCPTSNQTSCPDDKTIPNPDGRVYTGCTATAMGQLMRFWQWPLTGNGSHTDSKPFNGNYYTVNFSSYSYNWSAMPVKVTLYNTEVATLLYHVGVASNSEYDACGTSANTKDTRDALVDHFRYNTGAKVIYRNEYFSQTTWQNDILKELNAGRPVLYRGDNNGKDGHIFVCDGYQGTNYFHFNWGWNGSGNNLYLYLDNLVNNTYGIDFNDSQAAIIGILPLNLPDLLPVTQSISTTSCQAGSTIIASCAVDNNGYESAGSHLIKIYLSSDDVLTPGTNGDVWIGDINIPSVLAKTCSKVYTGNVTIPSNTASETYYVYYWVDGDQVIRESDETNNFATKTITITANTTILNPPRNLTATAGNGQISLNWSAPSSGTPTSYNVYKSTSQNGTYTSTSTTSLNKSFTGLTNGTTYWFYVEAVYSGGTSATSKISATPNSTTIPSNDDCYIATLLTSTTSPNYIINQTVNNATASDKPKASCDNYSGTPSLADVWYYFMATATTHTIYVDPYGSQLDAVIAAYKSCSSSSEIASSDVSGGNGTFSSLTLTGLTVGNYYYVRLYDYGLQTTDGGFKICVTGESSSVVDCEVTSITPSSETHGSTAYSTTSGVDDVYFNSQPYCTFTITENCTWLTVTPMSGTTNKNGQGFVNYSIQENTSTSSRTAKFYINGVAVTITQNGKEELYDDFTVKDATISSTIINAGASVSVSCSQCYDGTSEDADIPSVKLLYVLSKNKTYEPNDDIILNDDLSGLGNDDPCNAESTNTTIPNNTPGGVNYILFITDPDNAFNESNENNNIAYIQITVIGSRLDDDIYLNNVLSVNNITYPGGILTIKYDYCYSGSALMDNIGDTRIGIYVSKDKILDKNIDIKVLSGLNTVGNDLPISTEYDYLDIPTDIATGSYYLILEADEEYKVSELNENNNIQYVQFTIVKTPTSDDFYVRNFTSSKVNVKPNDTIDLRVYQCYLGVVKDADIASSYVGYYLGKSKTINLLTDSLIGKDPSSLGSDYPYEEEGLLFIVPQYLKSGKYYLYPVADYDNRFTETDENNYGNVIEINVTNTTDIPETSGSKNFHVYPNPVSGILNIEVAELNENNRFEILNLTGQVIYSGKLIAKTVVQTSTFPTGVYLLKLENGSTMQSCKIVLE